MEKSAFTITIHMASSLDGYIAKKDNSISWFETTDYYEGGVQEPDSKEFLKSIDCYVMGSRTYELALELSKSYGWAYGNLPTVVLTHRTFPIDRPNIETFSGDLHQLVKERLMPRYRHIWVVGGASLAKDFLTLKLADEIRQSILPIILGEGLAFFDQIGMELPLHLKEVLAYQNGIVDLCYQIRK